MFIEVWLLYCWNIDLANRPTASLSGNKKKYSSKRGTAKKPTNNIAGALNLQMIYEDKCPKQDCHYIEYCIEEKIYQLRGTVYLIYCEVCADNYVGNDDEKAIRQAS